MSVYRLETRVKTHDGSQTVKQGTGWQLSADLLVTAFHVVGNKELGRWLQDDLPNATSWVVGAGDASSHPLEKVEGDAKADVAILHSSVPFTSNPLVCSEFDVVEDAAWRAEGFPSDIAQKPSFALTGTIAAVRANNADDDLQLTVDQGTAVSWHGASGSPVLVAGRVVGILTEEIGQANTLRAARTTALRRMLEPHHLEHVLSASDTDVALPEWFIPRDWVVQRFQQFMTQNRCGYFQVAADAGLGKTILARDIARRFRAVAFFFSQAEARTRADQALHALGRRLAARYGLPFDEARETGPDALRGVLKKIPRSRQPVVLVLDAVDESDHPGGGTNPSLVPTDLPDNVFVLLTSRPPVVRPVTEPDVAVDEPVVIQRSDEHQIEAIRAYVQRRVSEDERITARLRRGSQPYVAQVLIESVLRHSEENFMYVAFVLDDVAHEASGELDWLGALDALPQGLRGYYRFFWNHFESARRNDAAGWREWKSLYLPTLQFLVASGEMVPVQWLTSFVGGDPEEIDARVLQDWRRFLRSTVNAKGHQLWGVVHQSFADYLSEEHPELKLAEVHGRIGDHYLSKWGGLHQGLPGLAVPDIAAHDDGYGLRHVMHHLWTAERYDDVCALADAPFFGAQTRYFHSYEATFDDLKVAVRAAGARPNRTRMLGLATAHARLKAELARLGAVEMIELYARFGRKDIALELMEQIAEPSQRARTGLAVARELFASDPVVAVSLVRRVLRATSDVLQGDRTELFRLVADRWPEELVRFLEGVTSQEAFVALANGSFELHQKPTHVMLRRLTSEWLARLRRRLETLAEGPIASVNWTIRFLRILLEPDWSTAAAILDAPASVDETAPAGYYHGGSREAAGLIIQARRDRATEAGGRLRAETVGRTLTYLRDLTGGDPPLFVLWEVVLPNFGLFREALSQLSIPDTIYADELRLAKGLAHLPHEVNVTELLDSVVSFRAAFSDRLGHDLLSGGRVTASLLRRTAEALASTGLENALVFLRAATNVERVGAEGVFWPPILGAMARSSADGALRLTDELFGEDRGHARAEIAIAVAATDLRQAAELWRSSGLPSSERGLALTCLLQNVGAPRDYAYALTLLDEVSRQGPPESMYNLTVIAEAALRLSAVNPERSATELRSVYSKVRAYVQSGTSVGWDVQSLVLRLVPYFASSGMLEDDEWVRRALTGANGLDQLVDPLRERQLHEEGRFDASPRVREFDERQESNLWMPASFFVELANDPATLRASPLLSLHLWHSIRFQRVEIQPWRRDHVKALWAAHVSAFDLPAAVRVAQSIDDPVLCQLTILTLVEHGLPATMIEQQWADGGWHPPLAPLALLRLGLSEANVEKARARIDLAYKAASAVPGLGLEAEGLDFLLEFVREAAAVDAERAVEWASALVRGLSTANLRKLHITRLHNRISDHVGKDAARTMYEHWQTSLLAAVDPLKDRRPEDIAFFLARPLLYIACGILPLDPARGVRFLRTAVSYAGATGTSGYRAQLHSETLQALLAVPNGLGWSEAVVQSLDFGDAVLNTYDYFGRALFDVEQQDAASVASGLIDSIEWAERLSSSIAKSRA